MTAPTATDFDLMVSQLMTVTNCTREKAIEAVRLNRPDLAPAPAEVQRDAAILESKEQHEVYKLFRGYGFKVMNLSQARASKQAPGLGDAWVMHSKLPIAFWWESKRQVDGELSKTQVEMQDNCWRCGVRYFHGDRYDAAKLLVTLEVAVPGPGQYGIVQK